MKCKPDKPVYRPSQILRLVKKGVIADPQPRGEGRVYCELKRHALTGDTESPSFYENGMYTYCGQCRGWRLARVEFKSFAIDLTGERKKYPLKIRKPKGL